jgi:hypothetical protein
VAPLRGPLMNVLSQSTETTPGNAFPQSRDVAVTTDWSTTLPVIAVAGVGVGAVAADFDSVLWSGGLLDALQSLGSCRSTLHVERQRGALRSTGRGSASATRLVATHIPCTERERPGDAYFEAVGHRSRRSFRPLCKPMA